MRHYLFFFLRKHFPSFHFDRLLSIFSVKTENADFALASLKVIGYTKWIFRKGKKDLSDPENFSPNVCPEKKVAMIYLTRQWTNEIPM